MKLEQINELTKEAYNKTAKKYHDNFKNEIFQKEYDRLVLDKFSNSLPADSLICDAGCGPSGHVGKYLVDKGHRAVGIDISQKCIDIAASYNPQIEYEVMDMMNTTFKDGYFDGVISFYSIIYTPKEYVKNIFSEFNRILKRNGKLLIVVKKGANEGIIDDDWYEGHPVYFAHFVEQEIKDYFSRNNFTIDFIDTRGQFRYTLNAWSWEIPEGGGPLNEDPLETAKRELKEETGIQANRWSVLLRIHTSNSVTDEDGIVFLAEELTHGESELEETEADLKVWKLPLEQAVEMVVKGEITDSMSMAGLLMIARQRGL